MKSLSSALLTEMTSGMVKNELSGCESLLEKVAHAMPASLEICCFVLLESSINSSMELASCFE